MIMLWPSTYPRSRSLIRKALMNGGGAVESQPMRTGPDDCTSAAKAESSNARVSARMVRIARMAPRLRWLPRSLSERRDAHQHDASQFDFGVAGQIGRAS